MSLYSRIKTVVETIYPDATFKFSSDFWANIESFNLDASELPFIVLDNELPKDAEIKMNNNAQKDTKIIISFLNQDTPDNTDLQRDSIIRAMEGYADRIAVQIYQFDEIRPLNNRQKYKLSPLFHVFNTDLSGVALEMQANENVIINFDQT